MAPVNQIFNLVIKYGDDVAKVLTTSSDDIAKYVKACGKSSVLQTKPIKTNSIFQKPLLYKPKYDFELNELIKKFDKDLPYIYKEACAKSILRDELKVWGRILNHNIKNDGLRSIGMNPINMNYETTFAKMLEERISGKYQGLFFGQGSFTPNVVVNNYLRTGKITHTNFNKENISDIINSAHKVMEKTKLPHDTILYRNVRNFDHIPEVGETFVEKGFVSTSINKLLASKYGGRQIKIYAEKGVGCIPNEIDLEILLKENSMFKVLSKTDSHIELLLLK